MPDHIRAVLAYQEIEVVLAVGLEIARSVDQSVVVHVTARLEQRERGFERVVARRRVGRIPHGDGGPRVDLEPVRNRADPHVGNVVRVVGVRATVQPHLPSVRGLCGGRDG